MQTTLRANALDPDWLSSFDEVKILSLDCFDTLLWRKVGEPTDVFHALADGGPFQRHGLTAGMRVAAEMQARRNSGLLNGTVEVTLTEIYRELLPAAEETLVAELVEHELACEMAHCFVFKPTFELIRQARAQGLKVVVVSDTYLTSSQLSRLLYAVQPQLEGMLDAVYCSSEYRVSKGGGIWSHLLPLWEVDPAHVLHLGDNRLADLESPERFGIRGVHLLQQDDDTAVLLRSRGQAGLQLLPEVRRNVPLPSLFHGQLAACRETDPARRFGYTALGPLMYGFADFILGEARRLGAGGKPVKLGFLLRDAFLPYRACAELAGVPSGSLLNISRFTAIAATLHSRERVVSLLSQWLGDSSIDQMARQLLLPAPLAASIMEQARQAARPAAAFAELVLREDTLAQVFEQSRALRMRLVEHVRNATGVQPGDTLLFVDLGYFGTAQTLLKDVLKEHLGVDLAGAYLLVNRDQPATGDRSALIDAAQVDPRIIRALTGYQIAALEMLCTQDAPSTVGYTSTGAPVFSASGIEHAQHAAVGAIQEGCLRFIADLQALGEGFRPRSDAGTLARQVAIDLGRLLYFPTKSEIDLFAEFKFDYNMGTDRQLALVDADAGITGMRRRGLGYTMASLDKKRTNYSMELRSVDLSLSTLMFAAHRYGFNLESRNMSYRREPVQVLFQGDQAHLRKELHATPTFDGYFSLLFPVSSTRDVAVLFGEAYSWLEIESVCLVTGNEELELIQGPSLVLDQMVSRTPGLYETGPNGLLFVPRHSMYDGLGCRVVFRPVTRAGQAVRPQPQEAPQTQPVALPAPMPAASPAPQVGAELLDAEQLLRLCGTAQVLHVGAADDTLARALVKRGVVAGHVAALDGTEASAQVECVVVEAAWLLAGGPDREQAFAWLHAMTRRWLVVRFSALASSGQDAGLSRAAWEDAAIRAGFRRAPAAVSVDEYCVPGAAERLPLLLAFERINDATLRDWPLEVLMRDGDLHMDMSRESGARADAHMVRYALAAKLVRPGDTVLDCVSGPGYGSAILAAQSAGARFIGIDVDPGAVAYAQANFGDRYKIEYRAASAMDLSYIANDSIDLVVSFGTIERLEDYQAFLREARRVLRPDGRIIASVPNLQVGKAGRDPGSDNFHAIDYPLFRAAMAEHFLVEERWAQTAPGGFKLASAPHSLHRLPLDAPAHDTEWPILVSAVDPLAKAATVEYRHPAFSGRSLVETGWLVDFAQHFDNPWLYRSLVQLGERIRDREVLLDLAFRVIATARKDSADFGAALTVLAYVSMEENEPQHAGDLLVLIERYVAFGSSNPHVSRWQISAGYAAARLALAIGDRGLAQVYFGAVERADFLVFSPLLATKSIASSFQLASFALADGDEARARAHLSNGVASCRKALQADDTTAIGSPEAPLSFGFAELGEIANMGAQCAMALELLPLYARSPGQFWQRVDTRLIAGKQITI